MHGVNGTTKHADGLSMWSWGRRSSECHTGNRMGRTGLWCRAQNHQILRELGKQRWQLINIKLVLNIDKINNFCSLQNLNSTGLFSLGANHPPSGTGQRANCCHISSLFTYYHVQSSSSWNRKLLSDVWRSLMWTTSHEAIIFFFFLLIKCRIP